jgi:hypothetical protein
MSFLKRMAKLKRGNTKKLEELIYIILASTQTGG